MLFLLTSKRLLVIAVLYSCLSQALLGQFVDPFAPKEEKEAAGKKIQEVFSVSNVGDDKSELLKVFKAIQLMEQQKGADKKDFHVLQRIDGLTFLVQLIQNGRKGQTVYCLKLAEERNVIDNEELTGVAVNSSEDIYTYTTASNIRKSVRMWKEIDISNIPAMTRSEFTKRLRDGETWVVKDIRKETCRKCFGDGKLSELQANRPCTTCLATGIESKDLLVKW